MVVVLEAVSQGGYRGGRPASSVSRTGPTKRGVIRTGQESAPPAIGRPIGRFRRQAQPIWMYRPEGLLMAKGGVGRHRQRSTIMKTTTTTKSVMAVLVFLLLTSLTVQAEEGEGDDRPRARRPAERIKKLDLSPEKEAQVLAILKTHRQAMANFRSEHAEEFKALREQMKAARQAEDKEKIQAVRQQMKVLRDGHKEQFENLKSQLSDVLSDEEVAKVLKVMRRGHRGGQQAGQRGQRGDRLGLDDDQKAKVKAILAEAKEQAKAAETPKEKHEIMKAARQKIHNEVFTDEQKAKAAEFREQRKANKLTDEQKAQVKAIMAEAKEKAKAAETREQKRKIMMAARKKVHTEVLTDQQRKSAKQFGGPRHRGGRMGGRGHGGRGKPEGSDE
ncbi:MAG TPA: DUF3826 domain-containing protein [Phycisphaerae bacterium]|nr:DUF3826 domain-containing protein [Phycisphaerae bacterium]HDZ45266.1 DUF3826 domain-containing protein [Phycisphaerae bacterium]